MKTYRGTDRVARSGPTGGVSLREGAGAKCRDEWRLGQIWIGLFARANVRSLYTRCYPACESCRHGVRLVTMSKHSICP